MLENTIVSPPEINARQQNFNITFRRSSQFFLGNPAINIVGSNGISHSLRSGETLFDLRPQGTYHLNINGARCKAVADFELKRDTVIDLKFNRMAGGIDVSINGVKQRQKKNRPKIIIAVACTLIALVVLIGGVGDIMSAIGSTPKHTLSGNVIVTEHGTAFNITKESFAEKYNKNIKSYASEQSWPDTITHALSLNDRWESNFSPEGENPYFQETEFYSIYLWEDTGKIAQLIFLGKSPLPMEFKGAMSGAICMSIDESSKKLLIQLTDDMVKETTLTGTAIYQNTQILIIGTLTEITVTLRPLSNEDKASEIDKGTKVYSSL